MNVVREINKINERELELGVKGSWHDEYKDSAYVFVGGLAYDLTEGDVVTIMSQYGEVMDINMPRDQETGKPKGFCFLMYEDQRSTVLAVDNMTGAQVLGRTIRVDHCKKYEQRGSKNENGDYVEPEEPTYNVMPPTLEGSSDESSSDSEGDDVDDEDPMAAYLRQQKKTKKITDGKKRKRDGESKEDKKARKDEKRRRKDERDRKRKEREEKKGRSKAKDNDQSGSRSRSPGLMKREREESRVSDRRQDDGRRDESRSRDRRDERDDRRSRHRDLGEREERHRSRGEDDRGERRHPRLQDDRDDRQSSRSRLPTDSDDRDRNAIRPRSERDESRSRLPDLAHRDDRPRSRPRGDRLDRDDRDYRSRNDRDEGRNGDRHGYDDRRPPRHDPPPPRSVDRSEELGPKVDPRMNPARAQLLAGGAGRGGYNGGPPRDDRFGRR